MLGSTPPTPHRQGPPSRMTAETAANGRTTGRKPAMTTLSTQEAKDLEQAWTFLALFHLSRQGLPKVEWRITDAGEAYGHVNIPGHDRDARAAIDAYATFLHATVQEEQHDNGRAAWTHLYVRSVYRRMPVGVWTHVGHHPVSGTEAA